MNINATLYEAIKKNNGVITTKQVICLGFSREILSKYVRAGLLERIGHGQYTLPDNIVDDMFMLMMRSDKIVFSHETALFLNNLSERTPFSHSVTIPSNASLGKSMRDECNHYYVKPELFTLGLTEKKTTFGNAVRCYDAERTICDIMRNRSRLNEETVVSAIKNYAASKEKDLNRLAQYTKKFKITKILKQYLEVLI